MTPAYQLTLADEEIKERLLSLVVADRAGFAGDTLTLSLRADNLAIPARGVPISCKIGYEESGLWDVGTYIVEDVKLKGPPVTMVITCISTPQGETAVAALQTTKSERVWQSHGIDGTTFSDVVSQVCSDAGLTARVDAGLASLPMPYTVQSSESDAAFLHRITVERNGLVKMHGDSVLFVVRDGGTLGELTIEHDAEVMEYSFDIAERYDIGAVRARWQEDASGAVEQYTAGEGKGTKIIPKVFSSRAEAVSAADALLKHYGRNFIGGTLKLPTRPGLLAELLVNLQGFPGGAEVNSQYVLVSATHRLSPRGLISSLSLKRPQG